VSLSYAFSAQDWAALSGPLRLKPLSQRDVMRCVDPRALLDAEVCAQLLEELGPVIGSPNVAITASLLGKRFSFLATGACLYAMSACDRGLMLSLDNCVVEYGHDDGLWTSSIPLADNSLRGYAEGDREAWRDSIVRSLFAEFLAPLWDSLHQVSGISRRILWDNTAVRVYSLYEKRMAKLEDSLVSQRVKADFNWLLQDADPALFGLNYNPLAHFRREPTPLDDGRSIRFRRTCCFYYQASNPVEYCAACPLLRPKQPNARRSR